MTDTIAIANEKDVGQLIGRVRLQAGLIGMTLLNQTKLITAASELARNMLTYAGGGEVGIDIVSRDKKSGIQLIFTDKGPGITDLPLAMKDGYTTGSGLGMGLPGAKRLASEFSINTVVGQGTTVSIIKWTNG
ncbi:anti-sigma regulatory factor [Spirosoma aerophilum]